MADVRAFSPNAYPQLKGTKKQQWRWRAGRFLLELTVSLVVSVARKRKAATPSSSLLLLLRRSLLPLLERCLPVSGTVSFLPRGVTPVVAVDFFFFAVVEEPFSPDGFVLDEVPAVAGVAGWLERLEWLAVADCADCCCRVRRSPSGSWRRPLLWRAFGALLPCRLLLECVIRVTIFPFVGGLWGQVLLRNFEWRSTWTACRSWPWSMLSSSCLPRLCRRCRVMLRDFLDGRCLPTSCSGSLLLQSRIESIGFLLSSILLLWEKNTQRRFILLLFCTF